NETTGVVITFVEITLLKKASMLIAERNEELQSFAYAISHDMSEPARTMKKYGDLLVEALGKQKDKTVTTLMEELSSASDRLVHMLDGTLQFSRIITRGENFIETSLQDCLSYAKNDLKDLIESTNTYIHTEALPPVQCDASQMKRVFYELISNSIKFRRHGISPQIDISSKADGNNCIISIRDNGIGVPVNHLDRLFQIFFRAHPSPELPGMGIGLAVVKRIVERHNGTIDYKPLDRGSEFIISLPIFQN
ncbi:MAG: ATP-binding protein, partial [Gammaproteobacteria bacterium]|nr:ATP-binding protein [Gammaproteobacteria bacterium]